MEVRDCEAFFFQLGDLLPRRLECLQLCSGGLAPCQQLVDLHAELLLDAVDRIKPRFDLVQLPGVKAVGVQPVCQVGSQLARAVVQVVQPLGHGRQRLVEPRTVLQPVNGPAQEVCRARLLTVLVTGQRQMGGGDARQNALGVGDDVLALLQRLFLAGLQGRGVDGVDLGGQCLNAALFVGFACVQGIQLPLDRDQLTVAAVILGEQIAVLGILIQQPQMQCRVCQALAVVLAVDGEQPRRNVPHHRRRGGHAVDAAAALALGVDLAVQKQVVGDLVAAFFQLLFDGGRDTLKRCPDARLLCAASHQLTRGAVA